MKEGIPVYEGKSPKWYTWEKHASVLLLPDGALPDKNDLREIIAYRICVDPSCRCKNRPCKWAIVKRESSIA